MQTSAAPIPPLLITTTAVRVSIRPELEFVRREFDNVAAERSRTARVGMRALNGRERRCALCGSSERVEFAHLAALEEGGRTTEDNLIPLCGGMPKQRSCHWLYDRRYVSLAEMREARARWERGEDNSAVAELMAERRQRHRGIAADAAPDDSDELQSLIANGRFRTAARLARSSARAASGRQRAYFAIREVECQRRRAARDALPTAMRRYREAESLAAPYPDILPRLYYEGAYVSLLMGEHAVARDLFERSREATDALPGGGSVEWAVAAFMVVRCLVAIHGPQSPWDEIASLDRQIERRLGAAPGLRASRWRNNLRWHRVSMALVRGDGAESRRLAQPAIESGTRQHALTGWSTAGLPIGLLILGQVELATASSMADARRAAQLLTRSVVVLAGRARQYPEGLRDALIGLADALERFPDAEKSAVAGHLRSVALQVRDGSSWLHPYRAVTQPAR